MVIGTAQASCYLNELLSINTAHVRNVWFEYKPWVGASAIWDAFIQYKDADDRAGFVAIEIKFSENLNPIPQLEREYGLAQSLLDTSRYVEGYLVLIAPELNAPIHYACQVFQEAKGEGKVAFRVFTLEEIITVIGLCDADHATALYKRYCEFRRIDAELA